MTIIDGGTILKSRPLLALGNDGRLHVEGRSHLAVRRALARLLQVGATRVFDFGEWKSEVASRRNFEFVVGSGPTRTLITRDAQHEYVLTEKWGPPALPGRARGPVKKGRRVALLQGMRPTVLAVAVLLAFPAAAFELSYFQPEGSTCWFDEAAPPTTWAHLPVNFAVGFVDRRPLSESSTIGRRRRGPLPPMVTGVIRQRRRAKAPTRISKSAAPTAPATSRRVANQMNPLGHPSTATLKPLPNRKPTLTMPTSQRASRALLVSLRQSNSNSTTPTLAWKPPGMERIELKPEGPSVVSPRLLAPLLGKSQNRAPRDSRRLR